MITARQSTIVLLFCLMPRAYSMSALLQGASGANLGREFGAHVERSCKTLAQGFQNGTTLRVDNEIHETLGKLANANIAISPATFNSASRLTRQIGFTAAGTGVMFGGLYSLVSWTSRYFEKTTATTYGDYAFGAFGFTALFAGAALIYHSDRFFSEKPKILKNAATQTGTIIKARVIERRQSLS